MEKKMDVDGSHKVLGYCIGADGTSEFGLLCTAASAAALANGGMGHATAVLLLLARQGASPQQHVWATILKHARIMLELPDDGQSS